jgi:hypothetical protein
MSILTVSTQMHYVYCVLLKAMDWAKLEAFEVKIRQTRAGVASDGAGDYKDAGPDRRADANENQVQQAEPPDEFVAGASTDSGFRWRKQGLGPARRRPEIRWPRRHFSSRRRRISAILLSSHGLMAMPGDFSFFFSFFFFFYYYFFFLRNGI